MTEQRRPRHISPADWAHMSWHAREKAQRLVRAQEAAEAVAEARRARWREQQRRARAAGRDYLNRIKAENAAIRAAGRRPMVVDRYLPTREWPGVAS